MQQHIYRYLFVVGGLISEILSAGDFCPIPLIPEDLQVSYCSVFTMQNNLIASKRHLQCWINALKAHMLSSYYSGRNIEMLQYFGSMV